MNLLRCRPASAASVASAVLSLSLAWTAPMASRGQVLGIESQPQGRFRVSWPASADGVSLEESPALGPDARWTAVGVPVETVGNSRQVVLSAGGQTRFYRLVRIPSGPARLVETSPADGETDVSVHRETVFRFDESLAPETQLDVSVIEAQAAGRPLLTRVELATDRRSAALFYLEPLPAGSRVEVRFDGFRVLDSAGRAVDADLDGWPGGVRTFSFTTVNATPVGTTSVSGRVLASEKNPDGTDRPLPGVTITVDGAEQELRAVTGADGTFTLQPSPAGRFFVHVDGRTSSLSDWPDGAYYPFVGKSWEADAGRTDNLAGGDGRIYLPRVPGDALRTVSATDSTVVGFSPSILASNPDLEGVEVRVPANALYSENGTRGGRIGIAPVAPDRLPEPLPPGLNLPLVITIQTDGPANFDRPVPVRFPNLPDPVTGEILGPGAKTALWSFDHDTGRWEIAGPMTISADGRFAETDPGVGVRQPGWHGASPGGPGGGPEGPGGGGPGDDCATCDDDPPKEPPDCDFFNPFCEGNNCRKEARLLFNSVNDLVEDIGAAHLDDGAPGCALGVATSAMRAARDCSIDLEACGEWDIANPIIDGAIGSALGCIPKAGSILSSAWTFKSVIFNVAALDDCAGRQGQRAGLHAVSGGGGAAFGAQVAVIRSLLNRQIEVCEASSNLVAVWFGPAWAVAQTPSNGDSEKYRAFLQAVNEVVGPESDRRWEVTPAERAALLALPLPSLVSSADVEGLVDRLNRMATGAFRSGDPDTDAFLSAATRLESVIAARQADGWESVWDGIFRVAAVLSAFAEPAPDSSSYGTWTPGGASAGVDASLLTVPEEDPTSLEPAFPRRAHFFALQDLATGFVQRGRMTSLGQMPPQILAPNRRYRITYLDPENDRHGSALFISVQAGRRTRIPAAPLLADLGPDRDADGLGDRQEWILGSEPGAPDSDGDGVLDGAEFVSGANPLDGREVVVGVIGGADTPGNAEHVAIDGNLALVADGSEGFGVFDLSLPRSPVRVAQISIPRARVAAVSGGIALVARTQGAALLDLRLPTQPTIVTNFGATAVAAVALAPPVGYFGRASSVFIVDLATARLLPEVSAGAAVHDLAVDGDLLHVLTAADLRIFRRVGLGLEELSRTTIAGGTPPLEIGRRLFAGGGRAYVGYFEGFTILDVSDPTTPVVLVRQPRTQAAIHDLVENGSGLLAVTTSFGGAQSLAFSLYDVQTADSTTNFITSLATPGDPRSVVIHKGLAYVADSRAGLQVVHFLPRDTAGQRPTIAFGPPLADISPSLEIGSSALLTFVTGDDVQVREVEVYRDGVLLGSAGSFPFQVPITVAPPASPGRTSVVLRARALDTAGNERWTDERTVALTPDRTPPTVLLLNPPNGGEFLPGVVTSVTVGFSEPMGLGSLPGGLLLSEAGPDGTHGTADDRPIAVQIAYLSANLTAELRPATVFPVGHYRLRATTSLADAAGQTLPSEQAWTFRIPPSAVLATTPVNNSNHRPGALTAITARFSALMDAASLRSGGFALLHAGPDGQSGTADDIPVDVAALSFSAVSNRMTFNPAPALRSGRYRATLTTNALDILGNAIASASSWNFTVTSPAVVAVDPPDGHARPINGLSRIQVQFSEPMDPGSLSSGLTLALTNGTPVQGGSIRYDEVTSTASLEFTQPLPAGEYRFMATAQATDRFGNPVSPVFASRFGIHGPVSWAVDADGRWDVAANWSPVRPGLADDVVIDRPSGVFTVSHTTGQSLVNTLQAAENLSLTGGGLTLRSNSVITGSFHIQTSTLANAANLRITGPVTWGANSTVRGGGELILAGPATLQGGTLGNAAKFGAQTVVVEKGPLTWSSGSVSPDSVSGSTLWVVNSEAVLEAVAGTTSRDWQGTRSALWNRGTIRQSGTTNRLRWLGLSVTNDGLWDISAGQAEVQGRLVQSGRLVIAAGSSLRISDDNGSHRFETGSVVEGAGSFYLRRDEAVFAGRFAVTGGATFESLAAAFSGPLDPGAGAFTFINTDAVFDNGPLRFAGPFTVREGVLDFRHPTTLDDLRWNFGRIKASAEVTVSSRVVIGDPQVGNGSDISGPGRLRLLDGVDFGSRFSLETNAVVEHSGTSIWRPRISSQVTGLGLDANTLFRNLADGTFELATNRTVGGGGVFENFGTLAKAANGLTNTFGVVLESQGNLHVDGGLLRLSAGGTLGGNVRIATNATLQISGANLRPGWLLPGAFTGEGTLLLSGGSNHLTGSLAVPGPRLVTEGNANLRLPSGYVLTNPNLGNGVVWLDGDLVVAGNAIVNAGFEARSRDDPPTFRNEGTLTEGNAAFSADIDVVNAANWFHFSSIPPRFAGRFSNPVGATYTVSNITSSLSGQPSTGTFDNEGLFRKTGIGNATLPFAFTNRGVIELSGALVFNGSFVQTETGLTRLGGGRLTPAGSQRVLAGEIHGPGRVGSDSGAFYVITNTAHLRPGGPTGFGVLTFGATGAYLWPDSLVTIRIGGAEPGILHDQLQGSAALWLGGRLRLGFTPGFVPSVGDKFVIVSAGSRNQTFRNPIEVTGLPAGLTARLNYLSNSVEAEVVAGP